MKAWATKFSAESLCVCIVHLCASFLLVHARLPTAPSADAQHRTLSQSEQALRSWGNGEVVERDTQHSASTNNGKTMVFWGSAIVMQVMASFTVTPTFKYISIIQHLCLSFRQCIVMSINHYHHTEFDWVDTRCCDDIFWTGQRMW